MTRRVRLFASNSLLLGWGRDGFVLAECLFPIGSRCVEQIVQHGLFACQNFDGGHHSWNDR